MRPVFLSALAYSRFHPTILFMVISWHDSLAPWANALVCEPLRFLGLEVREKVGGFRGRADFVYRSYPIAESVWQWACAFVAANGALHSLDKHQCLRMRGALVPFSRRPQLRAAWHAKRILDGHGRA